MHRSSIRAPRPIATHASAAKVVLGAAIGLLLVAGCSDSDQPPPDFESNPVTVAPATQWAGGEITLSSAAFEGWPETFYLMVGDHVTIIAERLDDTTYQATLPDTTRGGHYVLEPQIIESPSFSAGLDVAGWTDTRAVAITGTSMASTPWPKADPTGLLLVKDDTIRLVQAADGQVVTFPATTTTYRSALGFDGTGHVLAPLNEDTLLVWWLDPQPLTAIAADTIVRYASADISYNRFSNGEWLTTSHTNANFESGTLLSLSYSSVPRPVISEYAGRAVVPFRLLTDPPPVAGIPIMHTDSGSIATSVPGYTRLDGAVFSSTGTALYLAASTGGLASTAQSLLKVDPMNGTILDSVAATPDPRVEDLAIDEDRGWLLEAIRDTTHWTLRIRDAATLDLIAQLRSPTSSDQCVLEAELHLIQMGDVVYLGTAGCTTGVGDVRFARFTLK